MSESKLIITHSLQTRTSVNAGKLFQRTREGAQRRYLYTDVLFICIEYSNDYEIYYHSLLEYSIKYTYRQSFYFPRAPKNIRAG